MKVTLGRFEAIALAVWTALGISLAHGETISNTPAGLQVGDHGRSVGIDTAVLSEWIPNGATVATLLDPSVGGQGTGTLLDLVDHFGGGAATSFDAVWTGSATEGGAVGPGRLGGVGGAVYGRTSAANAPWTPAGGAGASVSTSFPLYSVSR